MAILSSLQFSVQLIQFVLHISVSAREHTLPCQNNQIEHLFNQISLSPSLTPFRSYPT